MHTSVLLRDKQVAQRLGVGRATVWRWASKGILPRPVKVGGITAWRLVDIDRLIHESAAKDST